jgi:hypothetical protein
LERAAGDAGSVGSGNLVAVLLEELQGLQADLIA